jgi:lipopolysaccharide assembly outer membrane protein LptD (OstA)
MRRIICSVGGDMRKRVIAIGAGAVLCIGALAVAQDAPLFSSNADKVVSETERSVLTGNVVVTLNGVEVKADRAVIQNGEVSLEGNVRMILPSRFRVTRSF